MFFLPTLASQPFIRRHGQALQWQCLDQNPNHQHQQWPRACFLLFDLCWLPPMPKYSFQLPLMCSLDFPGEWYWFQQFHQWIFFHWWSIAYRLHFGVQKMQGPCDAKIFYVNGNDIIHHACIHLGNYQVFVKVDNCRDSHKHIDMLIKEHFEWTHKLCSTKLFLKPTTILWVRTFSAMIVILMKKIHCKNLSPFFIVAKSWTPPTSTTRNHLQILARSRVMDGIAKLGEVSIWAYVQENHFASHCDEADRIFAFKMSKVGLG